MIHRLTALLLLSATLVSLGCSGPRGRVDPYETTRAEKDSEQVLPVALLEFADQVPERLTQDLYDLPMIGETQGRVLVLIGDFNNRTRNVPTSDFELIAQRIRNRLINSENASGKLRFTEKRRRIERLADEEMVQNADGLPVGAPAYDAATTYILAGDFHRIDRGDTNLYYMQFQLVNAGNNEIVFSDSYEVKQAR